MKKSFYNAPRLPAQFGKSLKRGARPAVPVQDRRNMRRPVRRGGR